MKRWVIGLASGACADGVDAALLELAGAGIDLRTRLAHALHLPYSRELSAMVRRVASPEPVAVREVSLLHRLLGETFAAAAIQVADRASLSLQHVLCIGCTGHTIWHEPEGRFPSALAIGMTAVVAERTGITTLSDFRARDLAVGGQGAPLAALIDYLLFRGPGEDRLLIHLGGVARLVYLPQGSQPLAAGDRLAASPNRGGRTALVGFEAGPCNILLNALMRRLTGSRELYDAGGKHAVQGRCIDALLQRWLGHPYFPKRPPKSLPRHLFAEDFANRVIEDARETGQGCHDLLCTATHFVARTIADAVQRFVADLSPTARVLLSGGGVRNGLLWRLLQQHLAGHTLEKLDVLGIPAEARKAVAAGALAALTLDSVPANLPSATGASGARLLGSVTPGNSVNWNRCLTWMAAQAVTPLEACA